MSEEKKCLGKCGIISKVEITDLTVQEYKRAPIRKEVFYLVWSPTTCVARVQHRDYESARAEAERLATIYKKQEFIVLMPCAHFSASKVEESEYKIP